MSPFNTSRRTAWLVGVATACVAVVALPAGAQAYMPDPLPPTVVSRIIDPGMVVGHNPFSARPVAVRITSALIPPDRYPPDPYLTVAAVDPYLTVHPIAAGSI